MEGISLRFFNGTNGKCGRRSGSMGSKKRVICIGAYEG